MYTLGLLVIIVGLILVLIGIHKYSNKLLSFGVILGNAGVLLILADTVVFAAMITVPLIAMLVLVELSIIRTL